MERLTDEQIAAQLDKMDDWEVDNDFITKEYEFEDFKTALEFVNEVGKLAETAEHHPDIYLGFGYAQIALTTHDAEGLTQKDFDLAHQIDQLP